VIEQRGGGLNDIAKTGREARDGKIKSEPFSFLRPARLASLLS
jgi:hypothetical protein